MFERDLINVKTMLMCDNEFIYAAIFSLELNKFTQRLNVFHQNLTVASNLKKHPLKLLRLTDPHFSLLISVEIEALNLLWNFPIYLLHHPHRTVRS